MLVEVLNKNNKYIYETLNKKERVEVSVRSKQSIWKSLANPIILPFSIHSNIYNGAIGYSKIKALVDNVKKHSMNKVLILLCEGAHLNVICDQYKIDLDGALLKCKSDADVLLKRFSKVFSGCELTFWKDFIFNNNFYEISKKNILKFYENNKQFSDLLHDDAVKMSHTHFASYSTDVNLFIEKAILDYLEMLVAIKVMHDEGYLTHIYPGSIPESFLYLKPIFFPKMIFINADIKTKLIST